MIYRFEMRTLAFFLRVSKTLSDFSVFLFNAKISSCYKIVRQLLTYVATNNTANIVIPEKIKVSRRKLHLSLSRLTIALLVNITRLAARKS